MGESPDLARLGRRLALLEDERAVLRTLYGYAHALDYGDEDAWIDLFTDDAVFDARGRNPSDVTRVTRGREALAEFAAHFSRPPAGWHKHLVIEPLIEVAGDEATSTSYVAVLRDGDDVPVLWVFGRYRDRLARCPDGRWRFTERIAEVESVDSRYASLAFRWP